MRVCVICERTLNFVTERTCGDVTCRREYQRWMQDQNPVCAVCGKPLRQTHSFSRPICGGIDCLARWTNLHGNESDSPLGRCQVCGVYTFRQNATKCLCRDSVCLVLQGIFQRREQQRLAAEQHQGYVAAATVLRDEILSKNSTVTKTNYTVVVTPHNPAAISAPDQEKIESFRKMLDELIRKAFADEVQISDFPNTENNLSNQLTSQELPILQATCSACRGWCCGLGNDHAYLSIGTIQNYRHQHPDKTAQEVFDDYVGNLPQQSIQDSCVFHTADGCNQPREMRSITCNGFLCQSLQEIRAEIADDAQGFFIVPEKNGEFYGANFVDVLDSQ